jgi:hypothetical protein
LGTQCASARGRILLTARLGVDPGPKLPRGQGLHIGMATCLAPAGLFLCAERLGWAAVNLRRQALLLDAVRCQTAPLRRGFSCLRTGILGCRDSSVWEVLSCWCFSLFRALLQARGWVRFSGSRCARHHRTSDRLSRLMVGTMVLMGFVTSIALAVILGTYFFRRFPLEREQSDVAGTR